MLILTYFKAVSSNHTAMSNRTGTFWALSYITNRKTIDSGNKALKYIETSMQPLCICIYTHPYSDTAPNGSLWNQCLSSPRSHV